MAQDFIAVDKTQNMGADLLTAKETLRNVTDRLQWIKDTMDHNVADPDYADIETLFGIPTGEGQTVYNLVSGTVAQLDNADVLALFSRVGR